MLSMLRNRAQSLVIQVIVFLIAIVFIFWGVGSNFNNNRNAAAMVNDVEIPFQEFRQSYDRAIDSYRQQFGGRIPEGLLEGLGIKQQVLDQLIQAELLRQGAGDIGIVISKEETQRRVLEIAAFKTNGQFNEQQYKKVLSRNRLTPTAFEAGLQSDLITAKMVNLINTFADISEEEVQAWVDYGDTEIKLGYISYSNKEFLDQVKVDEADLLSWYEGNQQNYVTDPQVQLQYLSFLYVDDLEQVELEEEEVRNHYKKNIEQYSTSEKRHARHILLKVGTGASEEEKAAKRKVAEEVLQQLQGGGDFISLAFQYSDGPTKDRGGDLGFFGRGQMVPAFENAVFSMVDGQISEIVETPFGYHLILLEEIQPAKNRSLAEVREEIVQGMKEARVKAVTFQKASQAYEDIIRAGSLAKYIEKGGNVQETELFDRKTPPVPLEDAASLLDVVFGLSKGELSSLVENANGYAIAYIKDVSPPAVPDIEAVRIKVAEDYRKNLSIKEARSAAEKVLAQAREEGSLPTGEEKKESGYLKQDQVDPQVPQSLLQAAFEVNGQSSLSREVVQVEENFYVFEIVDSRLGTSTLSGEQKKNLASQLLNAQQGRFLARFINQLRSKSKLWINEQLML